MNLHGCSLVHGHPQGPTGGPTHRGTAAHPAAARQRGVGLFAGCAAGATGAAVVVRVEY
jgi:acetyl-CoA C-acetyltransferase